jgi:hypothetical protein
MLALRYESVKGMISIRLSDLLIENFRFHMNPLLSARDARKRIINLVYTEILEPLWRSCQSNLSSHIYTRRL